MIVARKGELVLGVLEGEKQKKQKRRENADMDRDWKKFGCPDRHEKQ